MIDLKNNINTKRIPENDNINKKIEIAEIIPNFNKYQKIRRLSIITPKQMLQGLPIALAQVKTGKT